MNGSYSENLKTGGKLKVNKTNWSIQYYFSGPDLRYNGTFIAIPGIQIDEYINAWSKNFYKYIELKKTIPSGGTYETNGLMKMTIRIGGAFDGVCLHSYHMPIRTQSDLDEILRDYKYASKQAEKITEMLRN
jgi:hypothetical protein